MRWSLLLAVCLLSPLTAWADSEGTLIVTLPPGSPMQEMTGKVHFKKGKFRMDYEEPMRMTLVHDGPAHRTLQIFPKTRTYSELDPTKQASPGQQFPTCKSYGDLSRCYSEMGFKKVGTEKANGFDCEVFAQDVKTAGGLQHIKVWHPIQLKDTFFVRQVVDGKGPGGHDFHMEVNVKDLKETAQADSLFTAPEGYTRKETFGALGTTAGAGASGSSGTSRQPLTPAAQGEAQKQKQPPQQGK